RGSGCSGCSAWGVAASLRRRPAPVSGLGQRPSPTPSPACGEGATTCSFPPRAGEGRDGGNCRRLVVPVAMPRAPPQPSPASRGREPAPAPSPACGEGATTCSFPPRAGEGRDGGDRRRGAARCVWYLRPLPGFVPVTMLQTSQRVLRACVLLLSAFLLSSCAGHPQPGESQAAGDGATTRAGAAHTGEYSNLFVEAGYPRDVVDARIEAAF